MPISLTLSANGDTHGIAADMAAWESTGLLGGAENHQGSFITTLALAVALHIHAGYALVAPPLVHFAGVKWVFDRYCAAGNPGGGIPACQGISMAGRPWFIGPNGGDIRKGH